MANPRQAEAPRSNVWQELASKIDRSRVHLADHVPHPVLHERFRIRACHVDLTYPFVLS